MIMWRVSGSLVGVVVPDDLEAIHGFREDSHPFISGECSEGREYGYEFRPNNRTSLVNTPCINVDGDMRWDMDHRRFKSRMLLDVGCIKIYPIVRDEYWYPQMWGGRWPI